MAELIQEMKRRQRHRLALLTPVQGFGYNRDPIYFVNSCERLSVADPSGAWWEVLQGQRATHKARWSGYESQGLGRQPSNA